MKTGTQLKLEGIERVSARNAGFLSDARRLAKDICELSGTVTTDQVRKRWAAWVRDVDNLCEPRHNNIWGGVFPGDRFEWTGQYVTSQRPEAHGRPIKVWKLKGD